ncbi:hypothetical protein PMAYCL1PPCAC_00180, partial [Pristionchus mayeri]
MLNYHAFKTVLKHCYRIRNTTAEVFFKAKQEQNKVSRTPPRRSRRSRVIRSDAIRARLAPPRMPSRNPNLWASPKFL